MSIASAFCSFEAYFLPASVQPSQDPSSVGSDLGITTVHARWGASPESCSTWHCKSLQLKTLPLIANQRELYGIVRPAAVEKFVLSLLSGPL